MCFGVTRTDSVWDLILIFTNHARFLAFLTHILKSENIINFTKLHVCGK